MLASKKETRICPKCGFKVLSPPGYPHQWCPYCPSPILLDVQTEMDLPTVPESSTTPSPTLEESTETMPREHTLDEGKDYEEMGRLRLLETLLASVHEIRAHATGLLLMVNELEALIRTQQEAWEKVWETRERLSWENGAERTTDED